MKKFLLQLLRFSLVLTGIFVAGLLLPVTPRSSESLLFSQLQKDEMLRKTKAPRLILCGGSNLSFGIDSKTLSDSLHLNTINTGVHAQIGLQFMMDHCLPFVQQGDVVLLVPEYNQFFGDFAYGSEELLRTLLDVDKTEINKLQFKQIKKLLPLLPEYAFSKFRQREYFYHFDKDNVYLKTAFNEYGDVYKHWNSQREKVNPDVKLSGGLNENILVAMHQFEKAISEKGAKLLLGFPSYQSTSFEINREEISLVESTLRKEGFSVLGSAERYRLNDTLFFNTTYHLTKAGVDYRTRLLWEDIHGSKTKP